MKRYQILYNKAGFPLCVWKSSEEEARSFANRFRAAGYSVDVWEHTETGARKKQYLTPPDDGPCEWKGRNRKGTQQGGMNHETV